MLMSLINFLFSIVKLDGYIHVARRAISLSYHATNVGVALIEYGRERSNVIWPRNQKRYVEEIVKLDEAFFR